MTDEEFDDALDNLPMHKRNKVLRLVGEEERIEPEPHIHPVIVVGRTLAVLAAIVWSIPFIVVGMVMTITVVLAPFGIPLMFLGAYPLHRLVRRWVRMSTRLHTGN